jgi:hypothetical protein
MANRESLDEFIRRIEALSISDDDKAFLISVRKQFDAEASVTPGDETCPDEPPGDQ